MTVLHVNHESSYLLVASKAAKQVKLTAIIENTLVLIFINKHSWPLKESSLYIPVKFHLAMELYRDIHWCNKKLYFSARYFIVSGMCSV